MDEEKKNKYNNTMLCNSNFTREKMDKKWELCEMKCESCY